MSLPKKWVLSQDSVQRKMPFAEFGVAWLLLDRYAAPEWAFILFWVMFALVTLGWFLDYRRNVPIAFHDMAK